MRQLANLLETLIFNYSTNKKIEIIEQHLHKIAKDDRGYTIAFLLEKLKIKNIKRSEILNIVRKKIDSELFDLSYDYVGDLAETISLIWPDDNVKKESSIKRTLSELQSTNNLEKTIISLLNRFNKVERWALIKLILGGLRVGVSDSVVKKAIAKYGKKDLSKIEYIWNGLSFPYTELFNWIDEKSSCPIIDQSKVFHSFMLANTLDKKLLKNTINNNTFFLEHKWDGIRAQIVVKNNITKIYSRSGEDISNRFPEISIKSTKLLVLDGELLVGKNFEAFSFYELQKRINKKNPTKSLLLKLPAFIRLYDLLYFEGNDIRNKKLIERRRHLDKWFTLQNNNCLDISKLIEFATNEDLYKIYNKCEEKKNIEGLMIKRKDSTYIAGRKKGNWFKWKKNPCFIDVILMYAQRGHGKRSSYYSDFTFGIWDDNRVIPIAKAYSGYTDKELSKIDSFVRKNTVAKYGPVREVKKSLVFELAFDSANSSTRHKCGLALRFPRVHRIRWDKPVDEVLNLISIKEELLN